MITGRDLLFVGLVIFATPGFILGVLVGWILS